MTTEISCDVAIIGGGPGGSTTAALIRKYAPDAEVLVFEKAKFPRDHVGESQLPAVSAIINEMGCWDEIETAGFPLKVGATYRWGKSPELWDFDFAPPEEVEKLERPMPFEGIRKFTAFQVDRAIYDDILLRHAEKLGAIVREETQVTEVLRDGDKVDGLVLSTGERVRAKYYVDATGHIGTLRRAMGVETREETSLQNVAFWDYWENAEWAIEIGVGATRVQVMSQATGWMWFIPLGPTRTSIGYILPAEHFKGLGKTPEEVYHEAIANDERISSLVKNATARGMVEGTKDWSFSAETAHGPNWFLVGESLGFADPVLAAGLTLTHTGARELAYTLVELLGGEVNAEETEWLQSNYTQMQLRRVKQHIRFADFWYAANGQFTDLQEHCAVIAKESGVKMSPQAAWRWLAQGGFTNEGLDSAAFGTCDLSSLKSVMWKLTDHKGDWSVNSLNVLKLNLRGAQRQIIPVYRDGKIMRQDCFVRGQSRLPMTGNFKAIYNIMQTESRIDKIYDRIGSYFTGADDGHQSPRKTCVQTIEAMITEGWITGKLNKKHPRIQVEGPHETPYVHWNHDEKPEERVST